MSTMTIIIDYNQTLASMTMTKMSTTTMTITTVTLITMAYNTYDHSDYNCIDFVQIECDYNDYQCITTNICITIFVVMPTAMTKAVAMDITMVWLWL